MKTRQAAPSPQRTESVQSTTPAQSAGKVTSTTIKERAEAAKKKSQDLKTSFASATDKTSKRKQIRARLDALGAQKVEVNSGGFMKRLGRAFKKVGKAILGGIAKGALNIPKFFNYLGTKATGGGENWTKDFEKYKNYQNEIDGWVADDSVKPKNTSQSKGAEPHTDFAAGSDDYIDATGPLGDYLGFNAPTDELGNQKQVTAGDAKGAGETSAAMGFLSGAKGVMSSLDGVDSTVDSYDKSQQLAAMRKQITQQIQQIDHRIGVIQAGDPDSAPAFKELRDKRDAITDKNGTEFKAVDEQLKTAKQAYTAALDGKPAGERLTALEGAKGQLQNNLAIIKRAENREDRNIVNGLLSTGADAVSSVNGMTNAGAALAGDAMTGTLTQGMGGILGAATSLAAAGKDTQKAIATSKRVARADKHLKSVEGQARTQKQEKIDKAVALMRKNQAQTRNTKIFSAVKNLVGAAGAIALTVATFAAGAALMATPVGWALAGVAAVGGLGLAVYSAYKTIKRSDDIAELRDQKSNVQQQIQQLETEMNAPGVSAEDKEAMKLTQDELKDISEDIDLALLEKDPQFAMTVLLSVAQETGPDASEAQKVIQDVFNLPPETYQKLPPAPSQSDPPTDQEKLALTQYNAREDVQVVAECHTRLKNKLSMFYA